MNSIFSRWTFLWILLGFAALSASFGCGDDDSDDDSTPPGDDTADDTGLDEDADADMDDDADLDDDIDDDSGDDSSIDDATDDDFDDDGVDDDTSDDDTSDDDTTNDDTTDDDASWPAVCEDPSPGTDDCSVTMQAFYCQLGYPVIKDDITYTQSGAVAACRAGSDPVWSDIVSCASSITGLDLTFGAYYLLTDFIYCLSGLGWPAQQTDVFDATLWMPEELIRPFNYVQSLNFWSIYWTYAFDWGEYAGAVVDPATSSLRADSSFMADDGHHMGIGWAIGDATSYDNTAVTFWMEGWYVFWDIYGYYDEGVISGPVRLVPAEIKGK